MHSHERIDPRRGPGRERDDGRREIAAGVAEYEEDRDAERADDYDSREDWGGWDEEAYQSHEPVDDDARICVTTEDDKIVIEVLVPANMPTQGLAKWIEEMTRRIARDLSRVGGGKVRRIPDA